VCAVKAGKIEFKNEYKKAFIIRWCRIFATTGNWIFKNIRKFQLVILE
jgi:hypothetical protein